MKLPGRESAYIPRHKLTEYLLSETHPAGSPKAVFFRGFGFSDSNVELLERGLLAVAGRQDVNETVSSPHGTKYIIEGRLETPIGNVVPVRTVWIIESGDDQPRFVTAYPI